MTPYTCPYCISKKTEYAGYAKFSYWYKCSTCYGVSVKSFIEEILKRPNCVQVGTCSHDLHTCEKED